MSRKVEFLSTIKPILDKKGAKQDAIELARELTDVLSEIDIGADGSGFTELKDIFNAQLAEMGKQPIVFSEGTLKGIVAQFAGAVSTGIKTGAASIDAELERLTQKRTEILTKRDALSKKMTNKTAKQELAKFNPLTAKPLEIAGDLKEAAIRIREEFKDAYFELMDFQDDDGNFDTSIKGYEAAVLKAEEKAQQLMRMQKTLMSNRDPALNKQREKYDDLINGEEVEAVGLAFEQLDDVFQTQNERLEKLNTALEQVNVKIQKLQEQKVDIISDDDKADISYILKSLEEIEQTRKRISTQKGELKSTPAKELNAALNPEQEKESLTQLYNEYNSRFDEGADWEKLYSSAVRFVNKFESDLNAGEISKNRLPKYTELYDKLRPMVDEARESLKLLAEFKPIKGGKQSVKGKQQNAETENTAALHENSELLRQLVGDKEKSVFYDSKTGQYSRIKTGETHQVTTTSSELADASKKYDTGVHTHSFNVAAPSALGADNDIDTWIKAIDYIKKRAIVARDEVLSFDLSSLGDEDLQKISEQYKEAASAVYTEFNEKRTSLKIGEEFGTIEAFEEALQVRLREEIEHIMQQFPGVMSSQAISLGGAPTADAGALTPKQKAEETIRNVAEQSIEKASQDAAKSIEETVALLKKEKLTYEEILTLVKAYNDETQMRAAADAGDWDTYDKIFAHHTDIARKLVPTNMMGIGGDSPDNWLAMVGLSAEDAAQKLKDLYDRTHDIATIDKELSIIDGDEDDDIRRENGALEEKLELLRDIAEQYGSDITQKQRDRYEELNQKDMNDGLTPKQEESFWELGDKIDEADAALMEFEQTYDRIILKLANGKKVEILPNDKGLRDLYAFADGYGEEFKGVEIEDVSFERAQAAIAESESLRQQLDEANRRAADAEERAHSERIEKEIAEESLSYTYAELWEEEQRAKDAEEKVASLQQELAERQQVVGSELGGDTPVSTGTETSQITALKEAVEAVTTAVDLKTQTFRDEQAAVDAVITGEIESLGKLEEKINIIKATFEGLINNIRGGADDVGAGLSNVNINVNYPEGGSKVELEPETFNRLATAIGNINPQTTDVGNVLATENTLSAIKVAVEAINNKVVPRTVIKTEGGKPASTALAVADSGSGDSLGTPIKGTSTSGSRDTNSRFAERKRTALTDLLKYKTTLQEADQLHGDLEDGINTLSNELNTVLDQDDLTIWREHFKQFKNASSILQTLIKDYEELGKVQAKAAHETDDIKKAQYLDNEDIIKSRIAVKEIDVNINDDRFEMARQQAYNLMTHELQQKSEIADNKKQLIDESDALKTLLGLYKEYGALDAKWNYSDGKNEAIEQERQMLDVYKQIQYQKAAMGLADDDTRYDDQITKAWEQGFKDIENAKRAARAKATDNSEAQRIQDEVKRVEKYVKELGALEAELEFSTGSRETAELQRQIEQKKRYIELKREELQLDERGLRILQTVSYQQKHDALSLKESRAQDKYDSSDSKKKQSEAQAAQAAKEAAITQKLIGLYKELGQAEAKRDMTSQNGTEQRMAYEEVQSINEQIEAKRKLIKINDALENQFADSWMSGVESETKKPIQDLGKEYEKLGKLRAQIETAPDGDYLNFLKRQFTLKSKLLRVESQRLGLSQDEIALNQQKAQESYDDEMLKWQGQLAKERDKKQNAEQARLIKQQIQQSKDGAGVRKAKSVAGAADNVLISASSIAGISDEHIARIQQFNNELKKLKDNYADVYYSDGAVTDEQQKELIAQTSLVNTLTKEISELVAEYNRLSGDNATVMQASTLGSGASIEAYRKQLTDAVMAHTNGKASITGFNAATKELSYTIQTGKYEVTEYTAAARQLDGQFVSLQGSTRQLETPMEKLKRKMSEILTYFGGSSLIYEAFGQLRRGIQYIREIDSALTELKKVTDETEETYDRFLDTAAKTADKVGSTIQKIVSSTADWARLGYSMEDAAKLAESTSVLLNVSEFSSIEDATSALTSTMQAFGYVAEDSMHVVDILNEVGKMLPVDNYIG